MATRKKQLLAEPSAETLREITDTTSKVTVEYKKISGMMIRYAESGKENKEHVLLVHGGGVSTGLTSWAGILPIIGNEYHVLAPDLPGYGKSPKPKEHTTLKYYSGFIEKFMHRFGIERVNVIAESFGGGIAIDFTLNNKEMVKSLALIDAYGFYNKQFSAPAYLLTRLPAPVQRSMINTIVKSDFLTKKVLKSLIRDKQGADINANEIKFVQKYVAEHNVTEACLEFVQSEITRKGTRSDFTNRISEFNNSGIPMIFIHGTKDALFPIENQKRIAEKLVNAEFVPIETAHLPGETNPEKVNNALLAFLKRTK